MSYPNWQTALKAWNSNNDKWCIPKKGSVAYTQIISMIQPKVSKDTDIKKLITSEKKRMVSLQKKKKADIQTFQDLVQRMENDKKKKTVKTKSKTKSKPKSKPNPNLKQKQELFSEWYDFILPLSSDSVDNIRGNEDSIIDMGEKFLEKGKGGLIDANMITITKKMIGRAKWLKARRSRAMIQTKNLNNT